MLPIIIIFCPMTSAIYTWALRLRGFRRSVSKRKAGGKGRSAGYEVLIGLWWF